MRRGVVQRIARQYGCTVENGSKHFHVRSPTGEIVAVVGTGTTRERGPIPSTELLSRQIAKRLRELSPTNQGRTP